VAARAIRAQFGFVHIRVTSGAETVRTCEFQCFVTADACDAGVLSFERKSRLRVQEGSLLAHLPGIGRVARFARPLHCAMGRRLCKRPLHHQSDYEDTPKSFHKFLHSEIRVAPVCCDQSFHHPPLLPRG
jgi:hypothetical protein